MGRKTLSAEEKEKIKAAKAAAARRKKILKWGGLAAAVLVLIGAVIWIVQASKPDYYADIDIDGYGTVTVALYSKYAPKTVDRFVALAKDGFYDGLTFHRIIEGFMMQGGGLVAGTGTNMGSYLETLEGEFAANGHKNNLSHQRGVISMARANDYNSATSQFFIVQQDYPSLNGLYAAFGKVTKGMEIVDKICADAKPVDNNGSIANAERPVIKHIAIHEVK